MNTCPYCHSAVKQYKAGLNQSGSQRYECGGCGRKYTPVPHGQGYPAAVRQEALALYVDGMNLRRIGRPLKVDHQTVANWVNAQAASLLSAPLPTETPMAVNELDEVMTFSPYDTLVYYPADHRSVPNKSQTYAVEADHAELPHYLARLARKSRCFSRSLRAFWLAIKLFVFAWNSRQLYKQAFPHRPAHLRDFVHP